MTSTCAALVLAIAGLACKDGRKPTADSTTATGIRAQSASPQRSVRPGSDSPLPGVVIAKLDTVTWTPGPPSLPPGAQIALLENAGFWVGRTFTLLAKLPPNYVIPPHAHVSTERITVLRGSLHFGHGARINKPYATAIEAGGLISIPAGHVYYAFTRDDETIVALTGLGPWSTYYADPKDDPRKPAAERPMIAASSIEAATETSLTPASSVGYIDPPPGMLPPGAKMAILEGKPDQPRTFVIRLKFPDGYRLPVHANRITDRFIVVQGELRAGVGRTFDPKALVSMPAGSIGLVPAGIEHYAIAKGETVIQIFGVGPLDFQWTETEPAKPPTAN